MNNHVVIGKWVLAFLIVTSSVMPLWAQQEGVEYGMRSSIYSSLNSEELPFWFYANKRGTVDPHSTNWQNQFFSHYTYISRDDNFRLSGGIDGIARLSQRNSFHLTELYGSIGYTFINFNVGRFYHPIGLNNHELSAGSMMMSENAIAPPRVMIYSPDFVGVPYTNNVVEFKGMFSHGWFTEERHVDSPYLHQKYFYLKVNVGPFSGTGGIVHNAIWGGTSPTLGRLPQSFDSYLRVIMGAGASEDSDAPSGEKSNVIGNSLGAYEFAAKYESESLSISLTRLFYLEDGVSRRFRSPWDGVWGANLVLDDAASLVSAVTYEHINTKKQDAKPTQELGQANYYNHGIYRNGWANYGQPMGLSLMKYNPEMNRFYNNILVGHHLGIKGRIFEHWQYKWLSTYTRNYGTGEEAKNDPPGIIDFAERRADQYSFLLDARYQLPKVESVLLHFSIAYDTGALYEDNIGFQVGLQWKGVLSP